MKRIILSLMVFIPVLAFGEIKKVIIIPFSHQDIGFTATQNEIEEKYIECYNDLHRIMEKIPDFKFTVETFWQYTKWLESEPEQAVIDFYNRMVREKRMEFCAAFGSMHTGFMNGTTLRDTFRDSLDYADKQGIPINVCMMNDVPGFAQDLPDILSDFGVSYFIAGVNAGFRQDNLMKDSEGLYYWEGPQGGRVLTWVPPEDYMQAITYRSTSDIEAFVKRMEEAGYPYDIIPILAAHDNRGFGPGLKAFTNLVKDQIFLSDIEVALGTPSDFFLAVEEKYGETIPVKKGDWSGWWELTKVGGPYSAGMVRRAQQLLTVMDDEGFLNPEEPSSELIRENMLTYLEHANHGTAGWPGFLTVDQLYESNKMVVQYAQRAFDGLQRQMQATLKSERGFLRFWQNIVFNPLNQTSERLIHFSDDDWAPDRAKIVKLDGELYTAYPFSREVEDPWAPYQQGWTFRAPVQLGFTRFTVKDDVLFEPNRHTGTVLENRYYRVEFSADGGISLIYDKELDLVVGREGFGRLYHAPHSGWMGPAEFEAVLYSGADLTSLSHSLYSRMKIRYDSGPLVEMTVTLPEEEKALYFNYILDRKGFLFTPYRQHSRDYFLRFPVRDAEHEFIYRGPASIVEDYNGFTRHRPFLISIRDGIGLVNQNAVLTFASRHAFMANYSKERDEVIYQLVKHYSQCATKDQGIVDMQSIEPGLPDLLPFSFRFSSGGAWDLEGVERYMNPVIAWSRNQ